MKPADIQRREFIAGLAALQIVASLEGASTDGMSYRKLGTTGERVSAIGLGGYHIGVPKDDSEGIRIIRSAVDRGITFLDNSWDYHDGGSEIRMGKALKDGYRKRVFLMTKYNGRTRESAAKQIDESLKRLQVDVIDLIQFHENIRLEDPDRYFAPGGAHEAVMAAKKAGKVRYIGFTGHKDPAVHLREGGVICDRFDAELDRLRDLAANSRTWLAEYQAKLASEFAEMLAGGAAVR